ncbi:MAG: AAA family ATPase [Bacilli bacterium]
MSKKVILTVGASSAGKTTYAMELLKENPSFVNLNRDDIRLEVTKLPSLLEYKFNKQTEKDVTIIQNTRAIWSLASGNSIIVSDTNLNPSDWEKWRDFAKSHKAEFEVVYFPISLADALKRNARRVCHIPEEAIRRQIEKFETNFPEQVNYWLPVPYVRPANPMGQMYIVDIDGTLAHMHGRNPFDMTSVLNDESDLNVIHVVNALHAAGHTIAIMSGRTKAAQEDTIAWLNMHCVSYDFLFMRENDDWRSDDIVKDELFEHAGLGRFDIMGVFDDRQKVVDMWRKKGLKVFQCARGDF